MAGRKKWKRAARAGDSNVGAIGGKARVASSMISCNKHEPEVMVSLDNTSTVDGEGPIQIQMLKGRNTKKHQECTYEFKPNGVVQDLPLAVVVVQSRRQP